MRNGESCSPASSARSHRREAGWRTRPARNPRLRLAMDKAMDGNVPKDTIERAIKRAAG